MNTPIFIPNGKQSSRKKFIIPVVLTLLCLTFFLFTNGKNNPLKKSATLSPDKSTATSTDYSPTANSEQYRHRKHRVKRHNQDNDPTIVKRLLLKRGIYFGDYLNEGDFQYNPKHPSNYLDITSQYFDMYTIPAFPTHIEGKGRGIFDFSGVDQVADFAVQHGALIHGHNMMQPVPKWVADGNYPPDTLKAILKTFIQTTIRHYVQRYGNSVRDWDIINESMSDSQNLDPRQAYPNGLRKEVPIWSKIHRPGSNDPLDYIRYAFQWAHEAAPNVKLYWNEYNVEYKGFKMDRWFSIIKQLKAEGIPIDGAGFQTHLTQAYDRSLDELRQNMDRFASIGVESRISEVDVMMSSTTPTAPPYPYHPAYMHSNDVNSPNQVDFQRQAEIYRGIVDAALSAKKCTALAVWGAWDPASWTNKTYRKSSGEGMENFYSDILDANMNPKLPFKTMVNEVNSRIGN